MRVNEGLDETANRTSPARDVLDQEGPVSHYLTPELPTAEYPEGPSEKEISSGQWLQNFLPWLTSMDDGCYNDDTAKKLALS